MYLNTFIAFVDLRAKLLRENAVWFSIFLDCSMYSRKFELLKCKNLPTFSLENITLWCKKYSVAIHSSNVCESYIGKKGGKQLLSLGSGRKNRGHVTHELMHALGFFHEHTRPDRDKFVKILWDNIKRGEQSYAILLLLFFLGQLLKELGSRIDKTISLSYTPDHYKQFEIRKRGVTTLGQPYDFQSIMHYSNKEFSKNNKDTIQALSDPNMPLGNVNSLSAVDVLQINLLYNCPEALRQGTAIT